ncbi:hypothetical protein BDV59DRAFT_129672 [Aspergillus ambiguus]|uniref:uncharacterized protein n=1 Tax=Aspergillus ambiguus TaxID=176160 RepID=UPI003CCE45D1
MFPQPLHTSLAICALVAQSMGQDYPETVQEQNEAGAAGPSSEGVGMTSTGMIVLCTIVGVVVVVGISSAVLFVVAKKRQWEMREAIRRSARHVTQAIKTPLTPRFPRSQVAPKRERGVSREEHKAHKLMDLEKNSLVTEKESREESKPRSWGSYFHFNRA